MLLLEFLGVKCVVVELCTGGCGEGLGGFLSVRERALSGRFDGPNILFTESLGHLSSFFGLFGMWADVLGGSDARIPRSLSELGHTHRESRTHDWASRRSLECQSGDGGTSLASVGAERTESAELRTTQVGAYVFENRDFVEFYHPRLCLTGRKSSEKCSRRRDEWKRKKTAEAWRFLTAHGWSADVDLEGEAATGKAPADQDND